MTDVLDPKQRSYCMSRIRACDTRPELIVRRILHAAGYRYRLHVRGLPGTPDLVFSSRKKVVFIHGCFWHRHNCRYGRVMPATRPEFWINKFTKNRQRDRKNNRLLRRLGWKPITIWECQIKNPEKVFDRLVAFLEAN